MNESQCSSWFRVGPILLGMSALAGGCTWIGAAAYVIGPPVVKPRYVPAQTPMLVLADDYSAPGATSLEAEQLERHVIVELIKHEIAPMANNEKVYELRVAEPEKFRTMSIATLGQLAGASQVLYINMAVGAGELAANTTMFKGQGAAYVRVVDVASGHTLWPINESRGYPVAFTTKLIQSTPKAKVDETSVQRKIQAALADQIVKLFYRYQPEEFDEVG